LKEHLRGIYAITDPSLLPGNKLFEGVESALRGGVRLFQYRNKLANETTQVNEASQLLALISSYGGTLIINDDPMLCKAVGADGVHLGRADQALHDARQLLGPQAIIGVTCHNDLLYAQQMWQGGANYCAFGRLFPSKTKPKALPCSLETLREAAEQRFATVAIGGIDLNNASQVVACGVDMIAVIHALFGQTDIEAAAASFTQLFN